MADSQPLVSIIIPCYNHERFVQDCIQSVINQNYGNIELIIIDDGSKDNSVKAVEELITECENRFTRFEFRSRPNKGLSATLNEGLEWIEGKYVSCIASDDMLIAHKTAVQVNYLERNPNAVATFGGVKYININNEITGANYPLKRTYSFRDIILHEHNILAPTQMLRTKTIRDVGGYKDGILIEDWYMWLKLSSVGEIHCQRKILSLYRKHSNNTTKNIELMHKGRLHVLEHFKSSEYYLLALNQLKWIYALQMLESTGNRRLTHIATLIYINPKRTLKGILNRLKQYIHKV